jgi:ankyrin repeat protein
MFTLQYNAYHGTSMSPLQLCCVNNFVACALCLLENGANPSVSERNDQKLPLHFACIGGSLEIVSDLVFRLDQEYLNATTVVSL